MADVVNESITAIGDVSSSFNPLLSKMVIAVLILLIGLIVGKLLGMLVRRLLNEVRLDKYVRTAGLRLSVEKFIGNLVSYVIYLIAVIMSLNRLGLTTAILAIILSIVVLVIAVSFILAVKDLFPNLFTGLRIRIRKLFLEGDEVQIKELKGKVVSVGLLETRIKTLSDEEVIIPNSFFNKRRIIVRKKALKNSKKLY
jgi:small conductance mechanosensitive channel